LPSDTRVIVDSYIAHGRSSSIHAHLSIASNPLALPPFLESLSSSSCLRLPLGTTSLTRT
ncbi:hypothetical protein V8E53_007473, partial [Lactarius tabidus]